MLLHRSAGWWQEALFSVCCVHIGGGLRERVSLLSSSGDLSWRRSTTTDMGNLWTRLIWPCLWERESPRRQDLLSRCHPQRGRMPLRTRMPRRRLWMLLFSFFFHRSVMNFHVYVVSDGNRAAYTVLLSLFVSSISKYVFLIILFFCPPFLRCLNGCQRWRLKMDRGVW